MEDYQWTKILASKAEEEILKEFKKSASFSRQDMALRIAQKMINSAEKSEDELKIKWKKPVLEEETGEYFENSFTKNWLSKRGISFESEKDLIKALSKGKNQIIPKEYLIYHSKNLTLNEKEFESEISDSDYSTPFSKMEKELKTKKSLTLESPILLKVGDVLYGFAGNRRLNLALKYKIPVNFWVVPLEPVIKLNKKGSYENSPLEDKPPQSDQIKSGLLDSGQFISPQFESLQIRSGPLQANIIQISHQEQTIKTSDYPQHPDSVVISQDDLLAGKTPITELDIWNYYDGIKSKMLPELKGKDLFVGIRLEGKKGKPLYIRHPFDKKTEFIRINNEKDFMKTVTGRTVEIHQTMGTTCPYWVADFDGIPGDNFEKTKKITGEVADKLDENPDITKVQIRYTGKRGFHVLGYLKKPKPIDEARKDLKEWLKENFGNHKDIVLAETAQGQRGGMGVSPMKFRGGQVALWSMRVTGLCCVEVPKAELAGFKKEDARPEVVYKKLTGKTLVPAKKKEAAQRVINAFMGKIAGYDRDKIKPGYKGKFVIHDHSAEKAGHHFDLRLEFPVTSLKKALGTYEGKRLPGREEPEGPYTDGPGTVYRSFAVRKHQLPTADTKLLIVETEDHPIDYGRFKGKITEGYGKGDVDIFDKGTYEIVDVEGDKKYTLDFKGKKLNGLFSLIKYQNGYLWVKTKEKKASTTDFLSGRY